MKTERIRIEIWASIQPTIKAEMESTGLTAPEVVNIILMQYYGLTPKGNPQPQPVATSACIEVIPNIDTPQISDDDDDFL
jgi:hypothetical protein